MDLERIKTLILLNPDELEPMSNYVRECQRSGVDPTIDDIYYHIYSSIFDRFSVNSENKEVLLSLRRYIDPDIARYSLDMLDVEGIDSNGEATKIYFPNHVASSCHHYPVVPRQKDQGNLYFFTFTLQKKKQALLVYFITESTNPILSMKKEGYLICKTLSEKVLSGSTVFEQICPGPRTDLSTCFPPDLTRRIIYYSARYKSPGSIDSSIGNNRYVISQHRPSSIALSPIPLKFVCLDGVLTIEKNAINRFLIKWLDIGCDSSVQYNLTDPLKISGVRLAFADISIPLSLVLFLEKNSFYLSTKEALWILSDFSFSIISMRRVLDNFSHKTVIHIDGRRCTSSLIFRNLDKTQYCTLTLNFRIDPKNLSGILEKIINGTEGPTQLGYEEWIFDNLDFNQIEDATFSLHVRTRAHNQTVEILSRKNFKIWLGDLGISSIKELISCENFIYRTGVKYTIHIDSY